MLNSLFGIMFILMLTTIALIVLFSMCFKSCSKHEIFVVYDQKDKQNPKRIIAPNGFTFVNPLFEDYVYVSLKTMLIEIVDNIFDENDTKESFSCVVAISSNPEKWNLVAQNFAGLPEQDVKEIAENIIKKELKQIKTEVTLIDFYIQENYEKYFKQINEKLNKVGLELKDI